MSDDNNTPPAAPAVPPVPAQTQQPTQQQYSDYLTGTRDLILTGKSVYGDPNSPAAVEKLAMLDAHIALGRQLGEIAPAPEAWSVQRAAKERLALKWPMDPSEPPNADLMSFQAGQLAALAKLDVH